MNGYEAIKAIRGRRRKTDRRNRKMTLGDIEFALETAAVAIRLVRYLREWRRRIEPESAE